MKKVLLMIVLTLCIFQMIVLAAVITIGSEATDRAGTLATAQTYINKNNAAEESGTITSVDLWANTELANCEVATFFLISGTTYSTRDTHTIGTVTAGSKQTFSGLDIDVEAGDIIGLCYSSGKLETDTADGSGVMYKAGDNIPCISQTFGYWYPTGICSLYGIGATEEEEAVINVINMGTNF